jgi:hypothetical protein
MTIINTVHYKEDGSFLINKATHPDEEGELTVPDNMGNRHRVMIQEWIDAGNTPAPYVGPTDLENWVEDMARSDAILPRWGEDVLDGMPDKSGVAQITLDRLQEKKTKRGERP